MPQLLWEILNKICMCCVMIRLQCLCSFVQVFLFPKSILIYLHENMKFQKNVSWVYILSSTHHMNTCCTCIKNTTISMTTRNPLKMV